MPRFSHQRLPRKAERCSEPSPASISWPTWAAPTTLARPSMQHAQSPRRVTRSRSQPSRSVTQRELCETPSPKRRPARPASSRSRSHRTRRATALRSRFHSIPLLTSASLSTTCSAGRSRSRMMDRLRLVFRAWISTRAGLLPARTSSSS